MSKPPLVIIENPLKPWSPCYLDYGESYCPICKKGIKMNYPFEEFEKEFPDQKSIDKYLIENGYNPKMVGDWGRLIVENEILKALAASRLELNEELAAAALKVLRISLDRKELLRRAAEFLEINNPVLKEIKKELGDDND